MNGTFPTLTFRWLIGGALAAMSGAGTVGAGVALAKFGWHRNTLLMGVGCVWIFVGASAFLMCRDFGRQMLLGAMEALFLYFPVLAAVTGLLRWRGVMWLGHVRFFPSATPWLAALGTILAVCIWTGLRLPSLRRAMRGVEEGRRTRRCS